MTEAHKTIEQRTFKRAFAHELSRQGGSWLGTARTWLQSHVMNGDRVRWASADELRMTVHQFEDCCAFVAAAAINDERQRVAREGK